MPIVSGEPFPEKKPQKIIDLNLKHLDEGKCISNIMFLFINSKYFFIFYIYLYL